MIGDAKLQLDGRLNEVNGKALDAYGRVIDGLDGLVEERPPICANRPARVWISPAASPC